MALIVAVLLCASLAISNADVLPLSVKGNQILIGGKPGSLSGMSLYWSNNGWGCDQFYNEKLIESQKKDWKATVVRAAMGIEEYGGYLQDPASNKLKVATVVEAAIKNDMYVIIDWHDHDAHNKREQAIAFFQEMAKTYGHYPNVMYELWNEPKHDVTWKDNVKPYALALIEAIRAIDKDNLILVGSPYWSQDVDVAAADPITGYENIAYTLHFYAGSHGEFLRQKASVALQRNVALFVTEWGTTSTDGFGGVHLKETNEWIAFMKANNLSNTNWSLCDKVEPSSVLKLGSNPYGNWTEADLTDTGKLVRNMIQNWSN